jgi:hypothetical protein
MDEKHLRLIPAIDAEDWKKAGWEKSTVQSNSGILGGGVGLLILPVSTVDKLTFLLGVKQQQLNQQADKN